MLLKLHLQLSKSLLTLKKDSQNVTRDVQRIISTIIENDIADKTHENYGLFDDMFLFDNLSGFIDNLSAIKHYHK